MFIDTSFPAPSTGRCRDRAEPVAFGGVEGDRDGTHDAAPPERLGLAADRGLDLAHLAVGEDPVVQLAPPVAELIVAHEPVHFGERLDEGRAVDLDPAMSSPGALDELEAPILGGRAQ